MQLTTSNEKLVGSSGAQLYSQHLGGTSRGSRVHVHPQLYSKLKASLGYMRLCLKNLIFNKNRLQ